MIIALTLLKNTQQQTRAVGLYLFSASSFSQHGCVRGGRAERRVPIVVL